MGVGSCWRPGWLALVASVSVLATASLAAQAPPPITAADLEIYAGAVDSTAFPDEAAYVLLNEGFYQIEADGTRFRRIRVVRQILKQSAVDRAAELSFSYDPSREQFDLEWARVVEPDGTVISAEPVHVQEVDVPIARNAPVYSERKRVRASLGDLKAGRIIDLQYTVRLLDPAFPGDLWLTWRVNGLGPIGRSRLVVDVPVGIDLRIHEENLTAPPSVHEEGDRLIREWVYEDIEAFESEPFSSDTSSVRQLIVIAGDLQWADIARWYSDLAQNRYEVGPELEEKLIDVVRGSTTLSDSLRAVHRWVAQDIRYASITLGLGGYQPRAASEVLATGVGDCKDKTTLFLAVARHMGVEGYPVVVHNGGTVRPDMPSISQFNHMIAAIKPLDEWLYLDLTVPVSPYGQVFAAQQGQTGVLLRDDGTAEVLQFPTTDASQNRSSIVIHGSLSENGLFDGTYTEVVTGTTQYRMRAEFARDFTTRQRASLRRGIGGRVFQDAEADSLELFDGLDLAIVPRLWAHVQAEDVLREIPGGWMLPLRLPRSGSSALIARLEEANPRRFPIDAQKVFGLREHYTEFRIELPEGWIATLPDDVRAIGDFGHYDVDLCTGGSRASDPTPHEGYTGHPSARAIGRSR